MKALVVAAAVSLVPTAPRPRLPVFTPRVTIDCEHGRAATIDANGDALAIVGECTSVTISGRGNSVAIASTRQLVVTGSGNHASSNVLETIDVRGDGNLIVSSKSERGPNVHNTGTDNTIVVGRQITIQLQ